VRKKRQRRMREFCSSFCENFRKFLFHPFLCLDSSKCGGGLCEMRPGPGKLFCDDLWGVWKVVFVQSFFACMRRLPLLTAFFCDWVFSASFLNGLLKQKHRACM
jgi:hypothetical protein